MARLILNRLQSGSKAVGGSARGLVAALSFMLAGTACGAGSDPNATRQGELRVWVGQIANSDVDLGIVASATQSTLFFCGGSRSFTDHTHWFVGAGPLVDGARIDGGGWHVSIDAAQQQVSGTVVIDGLDSTDFSAEAVAPGTIAGVYDAFVPCGHAGLIVRQPADGNVAMTAGTCLQSNADFANVEQVSPVMPVTSSARSGIFAELTDDPSQQFTLHPLSLEGI